MDVMTTPPSLRYARQRRTVDGHRGIRGDDETSRSCLLPRVVGSVKCPADALGTPRTPLGCTRTPIAILTTQRNEFSGDVTDSVLTPFSWDPFLSCLLVRCPHNSPHYATHESAMYSASVVGRQVPVYDSLQAAM